MSNEKKLEAMDGWKWWQEAWYDTNGARVEFFVVGLALMVASIFLSRFPFIQGITPHILMPFLQFAAFEFSRNWKEKKAKDFNVLLNPFKDHTTFMKLLPLAIAGVVFGFGYLSCNWLANRSLGFGAFRFVLSILESSAFLFAVPLVTMKGIEPFTALKTSLSTVFKFGGIFLVFFGVGILSVLAGLCSLGIGFLFLLPLYVYLPYLIYSRIQPD